MGGVCAMDRPAAQAKEKAGEKAWDLSSKVDGPLVEPGQPLALAAVQAEGELEKPVNPLPSQSMHVSHGVSAVDPLPSQSTHVTHGESAGSSVRFQRRSLSAEEADQDIAHLGSSAEPLDGAAVRGLAEQLVAEHERALQEIEALRSELARLAAEGGSPAPGGAGASGLERPLAPLRKSTDSTGELPTAVTGALHREHSRITRLELLSTWDDTTCLELDQSQSARGGSLFSPKTMRLSASTTYAFRQSQLGRSSMAAGKKCAWTDLIAHPGSRWRAPWDSCGMLVILWEAIFIPLSVFRSLKPSSSLVVMSWITRLFWTFDIPATFCVGYFHDGVIVSEPGLIARHYLRTTLLLDLGLVLVDWLEVAGLTGEQIGALRIFRLVRYVRLMRLLKLQRILRWIQDTLNSEYGFLVFDFLKMLAFMLLVSHFAACIFWAIGDNLKNTHNTWIKAEMLTDRSFAMQYTSALHWSLATFLIEATVTPQNEYEFIYSIAAFSTGLIFFSGIVSRITALILQLQSIHNVQAQEMWKMRRFFVQNKVPLELSRRVVRYVEYYLETVAQEVSWNDVPLLEKITPVLRNELRYVGFMGTWRQHPLFRLIEHVSDVTMHRISEQALSEVALAERDPLFFQGDVACSMKAMGRGTALYIQKATQAGSTRQFNMDTLLKTPSKDNLICSEDDEDDDITRQQVAPGSFLSEGALWMRWRHRGDTYALTECCIITLDAHMFRETVKDSPLVHAQLCRYAKLWINTQRKCHHYRTLTDMVDKQKAGELLDEALRDFAGNGDSEEVSASAGGGLASWEQTADTLQLSRPVTRPSSV